MTFTVGKGTYTISVPAGYEIDRKAFDKTGVVNLIPNKPKFDDSVDSMQLAPRYRRVGSEAILSITYPGVKPETGCAHDWKNYLGFTESYKYCTKCNEKDRT